MQVDALSALLERTGVANDVVRPDALMVVMASVSRMMVMERALGVSMGHKNALALVEHFLANLEGSAS